LRQIDGFGQIDLGGNLGKLDPLKDRLDFSRIGIMGHSRGGQGISNTIVFNENRRGVTEADLIAALKSSFSKIRPLFPDLAAAVTPTMGSVPGTVDESKFKTAFEKYNIFYAAGSGNENVPPPYTFKGAFQLAPTDFGGNVGVNKVASAVLLPTCDGDMSNLQGAVSYDHNRFGPDGDSAPRYQIMVNGANHNYYNTTWTADDFASGSGPNYCLENRSDTIRLSREGQRSGGMFIINSFMRYHVGGEQKFAAYWNGMARLPALACPSGAGPCDERVVLTVQKDDAHRKIMPLFDKDSIKAGIALGGAVTFSGFDDDGLATCEMPTGASTAGACDPKRLTGFEFDGWGVAGLRFIADHVELAWSKPDAQIVAKLTSTSDKDNPVDSMSAESYDNLTFRVAVVRPMGQEVLVTLTDSAGKTATITASDFTDALYNAPRPKGASRPMVDDPRDVSYASGQVKMLMNMVAIPLKAFTGVDRTKLKELKLVFPKASGKVAITDIELQNLGREKPAQKLAARQ